LASQCTLPGASGGGTQGTEGSLVFGGQRWPDIVGVLHVKQGWGEAQVSGVIHDVNVRDTLFYNTATCGTTGTAICNGGETKTGWGVDAGVKFNLPQIGAGDNLVLTGAWSQSAVWYGGMGAGEMMWGEGGQVNGNGQPMYLADAYFNPLTNQWSTPTAWSFVVTFEHHFTPQFYINPEGAVGQIRWNNMGGGCYVYGFGCGVLQALQGPLSPSATSWIVGADIGWNPVTNLNFDLDLMYQDTNQTKPSGFIGTINNGVLYPGQWEGNSSGFAGRFRITRYF
jgi:hypothetical protein